MQNQRLPAVLALALTMLFWGSGGAFVRSLALAIEPQNALAVRYTLLTAVNLVGLLFFGSPIPRRDWPRLLIAGVAGIAGFNIFANYGLALVPAGIAGIITSTEPLVIALGASLLLRESLSPYVLTGMGVAIAGSILLFWNNIGGGHYPFIGVVLVFLSCISWAIYTLICKPLLKSHDPYSVTAWTMVIASPFIILNGAGRAFGAALHLDWRQWIEMAYLVVPYGVLGTVLWNYGAGRLSGAATGTFLYLIPVIAVTSGAIVLGEAVTPNMVAGGLVILSGVAIAEFAPALNARRFT